MSADFPYLIPAVASKRKRPGLRLMALFLAVALGTCGVLALGEKIGQAREDCRERLPLESLFESGMGRTRPLPARLSGFGYGEYRDVERDSEADWKAWKRRVKDGTEDSKRGGQQLRWEALLSLLEKDEAESLRPALLRMETAVAAPHAPATTWSDLAAVRYSTAKLSNDPYLYLEALENAEEALDRDAALPEVLFNRALCLEALGLWRHALETWEAYLRIDPTSDWADEARTHKEDIELPNPEGWPKEGLKTAASTGDQARVLEIVRDYRSPSRRLLEEEVLRAWGEARLSSHPDAGQHLIAAKIIADAYQTLAGDSLYRETVAVLEQAAGNVADPQGILDLARAHRDFALAVEAIDKNAKLEEAKGYLEEALPLFQRHGSPFAWRTELKLAITEGSEECLDRLARLREQIGDHRYPNLRGEIFVLEGMRLGRTNRLEVMAEPLQTALQILEAAGEGDSQAGIYSMLAEERDLSGQRRDAWELLEKPLSSAAKIYTSRRLYQVYAAAGTSAWAAGFSRISLLFWDELQPWIESNPQYPVEFRLWQARLRHSLGEYESARMQLDEARQIFFSLEEQAQAPLQTLFLTVEGELEVGEDPAAAVAKLRETLDLYRDQEWLVWEKPVLLRLARAYRALGREGEARTALRESLSLAEEQRRALDEKDRASLLQTEAGAFEELIDLELEAGDPVLALYYNERRLARSLLDRFSGGAVGTIQEITRQLPPDLTLIEYASVKGRWLAWVISSKGIRGLRLEAPDLEMHVGRWLGNIQRRASLEGLKDDAAALYRILIAPLGPIESDWVIIPDGPLKDIPFAALFDGQQLMVEKRATSTSPSASFFVAAEKRNRELGATSPLQALVMGNSELEGSEYKWLTPLRQSEKETRDVAGLYGTTPILGQDITRQRFLEGILGSEILQFSGHAVTHPESPLDSALILSGGKLTAREIQDLDLGRTRLAVLGACSTAAGPSLGGEGAESLARAFHAAGVPGVVASLWDVSDFSTSELMIEFHRQLLSGKDARQALRQAQLRMLQSPDPRHLDPAAWAAFQLIGEATFRGSRP